MDFVAERRTGAAEAGWTDHWRVSDSDGDCAVSGGVYSDQPADPVGHDERAAGQPGSCCFWVWADSDGSGESWGGGGQGGAEDGYGAFLKRLQRASFVIVGSVFRTTEVRRLTVGSARRN